MGKHVNLQTSSKLFRSSICQNAEGKSQPNISYATLIETCAAQSLWVASPKVFTMYLKTTLMIYPAGIKYFQFTHLPFLYFVSCSFPHQGHTSLVHLVSLVHKHHSESNTSHYKIVFKK